MLYYTMVLTESYQNITIRIPAVVFSYQRRYIAWRMFVMNGIYYF